MTLGVKANLDSHCALTDTEMQKQLDFEVLLSKARNYLPNHCPSFGRRYAYFAMNSRTVWIFRYNISSNLCRNV